MPARRLALISPDDPPPFEVINSDGTTPILLVCDHASRALPASVGRLGLPPEVLEEHIAYDIGAADLTRTLPRRSAWITARR